MSSILCCLCGMAMEPNNSNMCVKCLRTQVDITEGISKELILQYCRGCGRYNVPPNAFVYAELESKELLALCLKRIKGMKSVKLVDAGFVWTEPHSKRIKVKITIQREVFDSTILQQSMLVTYIVHNLQCESCSRLESDQTWRAVCQVRQKVDHKRTFFFLEQLILRHGMHAHTVNIKEQPDGIDFFFNHRTHALQFTHFLHSQVPATSLTAKQLVSQDDKSNTFNFKFTFSIEIAPVCRDDLVVLPPKLHTALGSIGPVVLCTKVSTAVHLLDPVTLQTAEMTPQLYFKNAFRPSLGVKHLTEYTVLDIEPLAKTHGKWRLADVTLARSVDLGRNDNVSIVRTHLGNLLNAGDLVLGYDLLTATSDEAAFDEYRGRNKAMPDIVLVRKHYPATARRIKKRKWHLRRLPMDEGTVKKGEEERKAGDYERFLQELEEDPEYRAQVHVFRNERGDDMQSTTTFGGNDEELPPQVAPDEMLEEAAVPVVAVGALANAKNADEEEDEEDGAGAGGAADDEDMQDAS